MVGCTGNNMRVRALEIWSQGSNYIIGLFLVAAAVIANVLLETYLNGSPTLFLFLCAIILATMLGGVGPGLVATALSVLAFDYAFLFRPSSSFNLILQESPRTLLFAMAALFVIGLIATQRNTAESLRRSRADLEEKVRDLEKLNAALKISETYLAEAQRLSHTGSFGWNVSRGEIVWSEESYRIFGYDPAVEATLEKILHRV